MRPRVAVVTIVHGRHQHLARQQRALSRGAQVPDAWYVVAMADPCLTHWRVVTGVEPRVLLLDCGDELPLAAARNVGARRALADGAEVLVFLDVDCLPGSSLVPAYAEVAAADPGTVWSGPVTYLPEGLTEQQLLRPELLDDPHPARPAPRPGELVRGAEPDLFWSLSFALSDEAWRRSGGFCEEYVGYGGEDTDFAHRSRAHGLDLGWVGSARAYHQYHPTQSPPVQHVDAILRNGAVFHRRWGRWPMRGWLREMEQLDVVRRDGDGWVRTSSAAAPGRRR